MQACVHTPIMAWLPAGMVVVVERHSAPFLSSWRLQLNGPMPFVGTQALRATSRHPAQPSRCPSSRIVCCLEQNSLIKEAICKAGRLKGLKPSTGKPDTGMYPLINPGLSSFVLSRPASHFFLCSRDCLGHCIHGQLYRLLLLRAQLRLSHHSPNLRFWAEKICKAQSSSDRDHLWFVQELGTYNVTVGVTANSVSDRRESICKVVRHRLNTQLPKKIQLRCHFFQEALLDPTRQG